ncbi:MAG TPA: tRNA (adenosine(37)-N6)-threonylcarbamoyltransferase complex dimerization subunit type 1 TsaB [Gemmatimonadales bacterium]
MSGVGTRAGPFLALDTATEVASVAVRHPQGTEVVLVEHGARRQAAEIVTWIDRALRAAGLAPRDLAAILVSNGPGSFTGLRISWAAAKGLAHEWSVPLLTAPSLLGAAFSGWEGAGAEPGMAVAACYDALRGQVFGAVYRFTPPRVEALIAPRVGTVSELARVTAARPYTAVGDGARRYASAVAEWTGRPPRDAPPHGPPMRPVAAALVSLLLGWPGAVEAIRDPVSGEPSYGRPAEAQARWEARHGRPAPDSTGSGR